MAQQNDMCIVYMLHVCCVRNINAWSSYTFTYHNIQLYVSVCRATVLFVCLCSCVSCILYDDGTRIATIIPLCPEYFLALGLTGTTLPIRGQYDDSSSNNNNFRNVIYCTHRDRARARNRNKRTPWMTMTVMRLFTFWLMIRYINAYALDIICAPYVLYMRCAIVHNRIDCVRTG